MQLHHDESINDNQLLSVVISICIDGCAGGTIDISNRNDGTVKYSKDSFTYTSKDNSSYVLFGSYVTHGVRAPQQGTRYSLVCFFATSYTLQEVKMSWSISERGGEVCPTCLKECLNLKRHHCNAVDV